MQFDFIVGNPPYGLRTGNIHLKILKTSLPYSSHQLVFIMPSKPLVEETECNNMLRNAVCTSVDVMPKEIFPTTDMECTAIYRINRKAPKESYCRRLDVEQIVYNMIDNPCHRLYIDKMKGGLKMYSHVHGNSIQEINKAKMSITDEGFYLNINRANGNCDGRWLSGYLSNIPLFDRDGEIDFITGKMYNIIFCPNNTYGENLKRLLRCPVLRYGLWLTQSNRFLLDNQFRYFPDIDYTTIDTDEGILRECGFTEDEIEKMMEYLNNFDFSQNRNDMIRDFENK